MPTYEYVCRSCGHLFDQTQKITEPPLKACPQCGGAVNRLISAGIGFIVKGTGSCIAKEDPSRCGMDPAHCGQGTCGRMPCHDR